MAGNCKTEAELFGVRPQVWGGLLVALGATLFFYAIASADPEGQLTISQPTKEKKPAQTHSPALAVREARRVVRSGFVPEGVVLATEGRESEPTTVLINELFSPDPEVRMTAALRLSRRSLHATEAVPVLKKLSEHEPDPKV